MKDKKGKSKNSSNKKPAVPVSRTVNVKNKIAELELENSTTETFIKTPAVLISLIEVENVWKTIGKEKNWVKK